MEMVLRDMGLDNSVIAAIHDMLDFGDDLDRPQAPSRTFLRDSKAMRSTAADILDFPNAYVFYVDMPGSKPDQIKVQLEDGNVLMVSGERQRDKEREHKEGTKYVRMERRQGKFLKRFELPENANTESITANYQDGVLHITVDKKAPPEPKKPKTVEIQVGGTSGVGGVCGGSSGPVQVGGGGPVQVGGGGQTQAQGEGRESHESVGAQGEGNLAEAPMVEEAKYV